MKKIIAALALGACLFGGSAFAGPVNINTADAKTIAKELVGIGAKHAEAIVKERAAGPYKSPEDMAKRVKGVGKKALEKNKGNILVSDK